MNAWDYFVGQCTYLVAKAFNWVQAGWGNAITWPQNAAAAGYKLSGTPAPGEIVGYGGSYNPAGHVAVDLTGPLPGGGFDVLEENYLGPGQVDVRRSTMAGVQAFIQPPAGAPSLASELAAAGYPLGGGSGPGPFAGLPVLGGAASDLQSILAGISGAPGAVGGAVAGIPGDLGSALTAPVTALGHGLAHFVTVEGENVKAFAFRQFVAIAVTAIVLYILFS